MVHLCCMLQDDGNEFTYTGSGGRDLSGNKRTAEQSCDQTLTHMNRYGCSELVFIITVFCNNWRPGFPVFACFKFAYLNRLFAPGRWLLTATSMSMTKMELRPRIGKKANRLESYAAVRVGSTANTALKKETDTMASIRYGNTGNEHYDHMKLTF